MTRTTPVLLLAALALAAPALAAAGPPARTYIDHLTPPGGKPLPFSDGVQSGDTLYVAGHLGLDPKTGSAAADPAEEARLVMDAVRHTLERAGFAMDDLVTVTVLCTDLGLYEMFNGVYGSYFHGHYPARAFLGTDKLLRGAHFEVLGVAVKSRQASP